MSPVGGSPLTSYLVRLAPELTTKSRRTRRRFQIQLVRNLRDALGALGGRHDVKNLWDRLTVDAEHPGAGERIARVFGVSSVSRIDARLPVVDRAQNRAAGGRQPRARLFQRRRIRHFHTEVRVAALALCLPEDQLVVAVVAGEIARAADPIGLDHADDLLLELDGPVEVGDVQGDVPDPGDHGQRGSFVGLRCRARARPVSGANDERCSSRKASTDRGGRPVSRSTWSVAEPSLPAAK